MYTKECRSSLFGDKIVTTYYKNGVRIARSLNNGSIMFIPQFKERYAPITRAKAYRYWKKHFSNRPCWLLPAMLEDAVYLEAEFKCEKDGVAYYG